MSAKRNRRSSKSRGRRPTPKAAGSTHLPAPQPPPARPVPPRPGPRPLISAQYVGASKRNPRRGRVSRTPEGAAVPVELRTGHPVEQGPERAAEPATRPPATWTIEVPRRVSVSTMILLAVVGLEVVAMVVLGMHLGSPNDQGAVVSYRSSYVAPVDVPVGTSYVRSRVVAPDTLRVSHWIHADRDISRVRIRVPHVPGLAPGALTVSDLVIASDGQPVPAPGLPGAGHGRSYVVPPGRDVYVGYVLEGALQHSSSPAGRALARLTSLEVATPQAPGTGTTDTVVGARVLALACSPGGHHALPRPCGSETRGTWRVVLRGGHTSDRVMAQLDLS